MFKLAPESLQECNTVKVQPNSRLVKFLAVIAALNMSLCVCQQFINLADYHLSRLSDWRLDSLKVS